MNLTPLQQIEQDIMSLEIELTPKASTAFKNKYLKKLLELRAKKSEMQRNTRSRVIYPKGVYKQVKKRKLKSGEIKEYIYYGSIITVEGKRKFLGEYKTIEEAENKVKNYGSTRIYKKSKNYR